MTRKVFDSDLAREIDRLIGDYGSDKRLAEAIGFGASRFTVMQWRANGTIPEKPEYVSRLVELGLDQGIIEAAQAERARSNVHLEALAAKVDDLTVGLEAAKKTSERLRKRVSDSRAETRALQAQLADLLPRLQRVEQATHLEPLEGSGS